MDESLIDAYASQPQYHDHIFPIWEALPEHLRGTFYISPSTRRPGEPIRGFRRSDVPIIVAGHQDYKRIHRPIIFVEHGIGENYGGTNPSYSGGTDRDRVELFICPNRYVAEANEQKYPGRSVVVGSPRVEWLHNQKLGSGFPSGGSRDGRPRVVVSFHWNCSVFEQTKTALFNYQQYLHHWATDRRIELLGHAHPRIANRAEKIYAAAGIPFIENFDDVLDNHFYAVDNSSTLFEAAALGLDVILLNAPHFPADDVGFRFWRHADIGPQMNPGDDLAEIVVEYESERYSEARRRMVTEIFGTVEGSAKRAAAAIEALTNDHSRSTSSPPSTDTSSEQTQPSLFDRV